MKLHVKIILTVFLLFAVTSAFSLSLLFFNIKRSALSRLNAKIESNHTLLNQVNSSPLYDADILSLEKNLKSFLKDPEISSIALKEFLGDIEINFSKNNDSGRNIEATTDVIYNDKKLGLITTVYSTGFIDRNLNRALKQLAFSFLVIVFCISIVLFFLLKKITKPITTLTALSSEIARGNLDVEIDIEETGEIGILSGSFATMRDSVKNTIESLKQENHERKLAERELAKVRNDLSNIIDSMPSAIIGVSKEGIVTHWNTEAQRTTGIPAPQAVGQELFTLVPNLSVTLEDVQKAVDRRHKLTDLKYSRQENNRVIHENITIYPLVSNGIDGAVIRIDDITREKLLEDQLNHSRKMEAVGTLASGVAHDFNNMLGGIMGAADLMAMYLPDNPKAKKLNQTILDAAERAAQLTAQLLTFSRNKTQASTVIDLHQIIQDTAVLLKNTIDRRITIDLDLVSGESTIIGDPSQMESIFLNLGINGAHAMPDGGNLSIVSKKIELDEIYCNASIFDIRPGSYLEVEVRDTGHGITHENLGKIFDPFFTTKGQDAGTGLGLAMVYGSVKRHKGAIHVYSEPDEGTVFSILLPLAEKEEAAASPVQQIVKGSGRILVVDDEEVMRVTAEAILEDLGYQVLLAEDGEHAVEIYLEQRDNIDLIILDMVMPKMNGRDCFFKLKEINKNVQIILSSGFSRKEDVDEMTNSGLAGFVKKPYRRIDLSLALHNILAHNA